MNPIDAYLADLGSHLKLRGAARREALTETLELLTEQAVASSPEEAIAQAGPAADYATSLDALFGADQAAAHWFGIPTSFGRGLAARMAGTFNPSDARILVPKVFGAGWTFNSGAIAVRLGMLNADDGDDEVLRTAAERHLAPSQVVAGLATLAAATAGVWQWRERHAIAAVLGKPQTSNAIAGLVMPLVAATVLAASHDEQQRPDARLSMPGLAASLALLATGLSVQQATRPGGSSYVLSGLAGALAAQLLLGYAPVRSAVDAAFVSDIFAGPVRDE